MDARVPPVSLQRENLAHLRGRITAEPETRKWNSCGLSKLLRFRVQRRIDQALLGRNECA